MSDSRIVSIHKKLAELVGVDFASGYSGIDFTNRVVRTGETEPVTTPFCSVVFVDSLEKFGPTMGRYSGEAIFEVYCFVTGSNTEKRNDEALNVISDMIKAITANRQLGLGSLVDDVICSFKSIDGNVFGLNSIQIGFIEVKVSYKSEDGA